MLCARVGLGQSVQALAIKWIEHADQRCASLHPGKFLSLGCPYFQHQLRAQRLVRPAEGRARSDAGLIGLGRAHAGPPFNDDLMTGGDQLLDGFCRGGDSRLSGASLGGYADTHATSLGGYGVCRGSADSISGVTGRDSKARI
jgi:hypothetical protein